MGLLNAFLAGLRMWPSRSEESSILEFHLWLAARVEELDDSHNMVCWWLEALGPKRGLEAFFRYLDEFRANTVELTHVSAGPLKPRFARGDGSPPPIPQRLVVGRFVPSNIHFWGEQWDLTFLEKQSHFCHSARKAKSLAAERWDIPPGTWEKLDQPEPVRHPLVGLWGLLDRIRRRPGMYCDPASQPLTTLQSTLWGYEAAIDEHRVPDEGRGFNKAFSWYLEVRFGWSTSCGWARAIREHLRADEEELSKFFQLVDEFCGVVEEVADDLRTVSLRLEAISRRMEGFRRRRRDWVVDQLCAHRSERGQGAGRAGWGTRDEEQRWVSANGQGRGPRSPKGTRTAASACRLRDTSIFDATNERLLLQDRS